VLDVFVGAQGVVIYYEVVAGLLACEAFTFGRNRLVTRAAAHYNPV
jgi:hypothetical protein